MMLTRRVTKIDIEWLAAVGNLLEEEREQNLGRPVYRAITQDWLWTGNMRVEVTKKRQFLRATTQEWWGTLTERAEGLEYEKNSSCHYTGMTEKS